MSRHVPTPPCPAEPFESRLRTARRLLLTGHPHRTAERCARLRTRAAATGAHRWQAAFGALRAEALVCQGDLAAAEREAVTAVQATDRDTPLRLWPVAALVEALTELGHHDEADRRLRRAVPGPLPLTEDVLPYLRARSRHFLAVRCPREALADALHAGELAALQKGGLFTELPWRTDAAQALLQLGRPDRAAELIDAQLTEATLGPRPRGIALRLRAAGEAPAERPATLALAAVELRAAGDRPEQARVLADMADALRALGDDTTSEAVLQRAWGLAADCGAVPLCERLQPTTAA
jgi:hypothetical protein